MFEISTGLTLNYQLQDQEYKNNYYPILRKLLFLNKRQQLPIGAKALQESIKHRNIQIEMVSEILNELYSNGVLQKHYHPEIEYDFC